MGFGKEEQTRHRQKVRFAFVWGIAMKECGSLLTPQRCHRFLYSPEVRDAVCDVQKLSVTVTILADRQRVYATVGWAKLYVDFMRTYVELFRPVWTYIDLFGPIQPLWTH